MSWDHEMTFSQRVYQAYASLAEGRQNPDVPIAELHARVGGSLPELHDWLQAECFAHRAVPTTGEPAFANEEDKRTALTLPGESDAFLNIKLLNLPTMTQEQLTAEEQKIRALAELVRGYTEIRRAANEQGKNVLYAGRLAEIAEASRQLAEEVTAYLQRQQQEEALALADPVMKYERLLRETAALRYPPALRSPQLEASIEGTIQSRVVAFQQEQRHLAQLEASLHQQVAEQHPDLTPEQVRQYSERIDRILREETERMARGQRPSPTREIPSPEREVQQSQAQGREMAQCA